MKRMCLVLSVVITAGTAFACPAADDFPDPVNTQAAGEPDVQQPIAFDFDDEGRIWVAENYSYGAHGKYDPDHRDRASRSCGRLGQ